MAADESTRIASANVANAGCPATSSGRRSSTIPTVASHAPQNVTRGADRCPLVVERTARRQPFFRQSMQEEQIGQPGARLGGLHIAEDFAPVVEPFFRDASIS